VESFSHSGRQLQLKSLLAAIPAPIPSIFFLSPSCLFLKKTVFLFLFTTPSIFLLPCPSVLFPPPHLYPTRLSVGGSLTRVFFCISPRLLLQDLLGPLFTPCALRPFKFVNLIYPNPHPFLALFYIPSPLP